MVRFRRLNSQIGLTLILLLTACKLDIKSSARTSSTSEATPAATPAATPQYKLVMGGASATACFLYEGLAPRCWGLNYGSFANGSTVNSNPTLQTSGYDLSASMQMSIGGSASCYLNTDGSIRCSGDNNSSQMGFGFAEEAQYYTPQTPVGGLLDFKTITSGGSTTCAGKADSTYYCWGYNANHELGTGNTSAVDQPTLHAGLTGASQVSLGKTNGCAIFSGGVLKCWGHNNVGEIGNGIVGTPAPNPVDVSTSVRFKKVQAGWGVACGISTDDRVYCWGGVSGFSLVDSATPVDTGLTNIVDLSLVGMHACALNSAGRVFCWGDNQYGQLGDGGTSPSSIPLEISTVPNAVSIGTSDRGSCVLVKVTSGFEAYCWGDNTYGIQGPTPGDPIAL